MNCEMQCPKTKNAFKKDISPLMDAYYDKNKYFNDKFKKYYKLNKDIVNIVLCTSLNGYGLVFIMVLIK